MIDRSPDYTRREATNHSSSSVDRKLLYSTQISENIPYISSDTTISLSDNEGIMNRREIRRALAHCPARSAEDSARGGKSKAQLPSLLRSHLLLRLRVCFEGASGSADKDPSNIWSRSTLHETNHVELWLAYIHFSVGNRDAN